MPSAELIAIGTELLLGEIQDTNSHYLARQLRDAGIDLFRTTSIGDNASRIAAAVNEALKRVDIVITTGGLGPTVDDPTRDAIALAFSTSTEFHPELWSSIENRFLKRGVIPTENNKRQAYLPLGAIVILNPVGTAPAFYFERGEKIVFCLPGVPKEMEFLTSESVLPLLKSKYELDSVIKVRVIHLSGIGESVVDQPIAEFERMSNPTVGLLSHPGIVDIRITAKAATPEDADQMIAPVESQILALFPGDVYGIDDQTLPDCILDLCRNKQITLEIIESGLSDSWPDLLFSEKFVEISHNRTKEQITTPSEDNKALCLFCSYREVEMECHLQYILQQNGIIEEKTLIYSGPQAQGKQWAINRAMDVLRRHLQQI